MPVKGAGYRQTSRGLLKKKTEEVVRDIQEAVRERQFADHDPLLDWEPGLRAHQVRRVGTWGRGQDEG